MEYYSKSAAEIAAEFNSDLNGGLSAENLKKNTAKYGLNKLSEKKKRGFFARVFAAAKEPMLVILMFGFVIAFGTNLGKYIKTGEADFAECIGILLAVVLSVSITLIMEGSSEKAFAALARIYDNASVRVIREGQTVVVSQNYVTVGDIVILESGDKIAADGRLIESESLSVDESALTGESHSGFKDAGARLSPGVPLAERKNFVYSGTFVRAGSGKMLVTAVGDKTEMGNIAGELRDKGGENSPLQHKLSSLGKVITAIGAAAAIFVFALSVARLVITGNFSFDSLQELFISCIILIVAAVPEGLPTIVAVSLALNMIKLAKENALIKKMVATETAGAVSVICSDKTGTLTMNEMTVMSVCVGEYCVSPQKIKDEIFIRNFICNSTADAVKGGAGGQYVGSGTECALLAAAKKKEPDVSFREYRKRFPAVAREPFSSQKKYMVTVIREESGYRVLIKGAPEKVLALCSMTNERRARILADMEEYGKNAKRIICFGHLDADTEEIPTGGYVYDGYAVLSDPVRPDVKAAVAECKSAGIKVKVLTGDNAVTAFAVAKELDIASSRTEVINGAELEKIDDATLKKLLPKITVVARSTPIIKLRIVKLLKEMGEVVAVTGDGINDAPAIKRADVGIAMGRTGSEITKEAADVILLNDSFSTIVKAVSFGRNVYRNLQRFILFQLSVNLSALLFITVCAVMGLEPPFNALQLLWINVIMDGPPALTLGLESAGAGVMKLKPVKRSQGIVGIKMLARIIFNGIFIASVLVAEELYDFLGAGAAKESAVFTLFILFQLFNAFNSRELGADSIFKRLGKNKIMVATFAGVFLVHFVIVQAGYGMFSITPMNFALWIKCVGTAFSVIAVSEAYKFVYRALRGKNNGENKKRRAAGKINEVNKNYFGA